MAKEKSEVKGWITRNGVHIPIYKTKYISADYNDSLKRWAVQNDTVSKKDKEVIEDFIQQAPAVNNKHGLTRGISMSQEELDKLQVGKTFKENKLASWSTRVGIAQAFARNNESDKKPYKVIIKLTGETNKAAKIGTHGGRRYDEGEAVMSSKASFKITKIKIDKPNYTYVWVEEQTKDKKKGKSE